MPEALPAPRAPAAVDQQSSKGERTSVPTSAARPWSGRRLQAIEHADLHRYLHRTPIIPAWRRPMSPQRARTNEYSKARNSLPNCVSLASAYGSRWRLLDCLWIMHRRHPRNKATGYAGINCSSLSHMNDTPRRRELSIFLRTQRECISPEAVGLKTDHRCRTPGLRSEEVAARAGVGAPGTVS
jgi:hypothetical protein